MPTVNLPRGDWETILLIIESLQITKQYHKGVIMALHKEISDQVYRQEY